MFVALKVPGLGFSHALIEADRFNQETRRALTKALQLNRCQSVPPPNSGSPFAERAPLTGLPAVHLEDNNLVDETSWAKRQAAKGGGQLEKKVGFERELVFPLSFVHHEGQDGSETLLAVHEADQYIAVIHADTNGLGDVVNSVYKAVGKDPNLFPALPAGFSQAIEKATLTAAKIASHQIMRDVRELPGSPHEKLVPMRFLVLGGDDVTLVTKACHALDWVKNFQSYFQQETEKALQKYKGYGVPSYLTASAGITFIKAKQPFHMAYHLTESLCSEAKQAGRSARASRDGSKQTSEPTPPTLAFHRITSAMIDDWSTVLEREKTTLDKRKLTMQPYVNEDYSSSGLPELSCLRNLAVLLSEMGQGTVRELVKSFHQGEAFTRKAERRLFENLKLRNSPILTELQQVLQELTGQPQEEAFAFFDDQKRTPLADAIALNDVGYKEELHEHLSTAL
jgi:hypothetical protein